MSKTIKLEDPVYFDLDDVKEKHETFSQAVARLIDLYRQLRGLEPILRGDKAYHEFMDSRKGELK